MTDQDPWLGQPSGDQDIDGWAPPGVDTTMPHSARVYDYWLGGKTNFAVDRAMGAAVEQAIPTIATMARENRKFLGRAVRYLTAEAGMRQFLDIGTGIPTEGNVHEIAQQIAPEARVVYVDNDPIVLAHARALMVSGDMGRTAYIHADVRDAKQILTHPTLTEILDLNQPVGLVMVAVMMLVPDHDDPWGKAATLRDALPSGSYMALSHHGVEFNPEAMAGNVAAAAQGGVTLVPRTKEDVARFFGDWELVEPGIVPVMAWHPDGGPPEDPDAAYLWSGVARKP